MRPDAIRLTAIERARIAYEAMKQRRRDAALQRRARERSRHIKLAAIAVAMATLLIGVTVHNGWLPTSLRSSVQATRADNSKFGETRTGQVRSFIRGNTCQELQFDNDIGLYVGGSLGPCRAETKREPVPPVLPKDARINSIREAFTAR